LNGFVIETIMYREVGVFTGEYGAL
jgi:hypothetical protein